MSNTTKRDDPALYSGTSVWMSKQGYGDLVGAKDGKNLYWTTDINVELPIKMPASGMGAEIKPETLPNKFRATAALRGDASAVFIQRNKKVYTWSWRQYWNDSFAFAKSLRAVGVEARKAVNIYGYNSPEWAIAFWGAMMHNNVVSGVYITNGAEACHYQAQHSEAQVIVVDNLEQLKLYMGIIERLPEVKAVVAWGVETIPEEFAKDSRVYTYKAFLELGAKVKDTDIDAIIAQQKPGECCCLIYTSGTTGHPKGVMLSHDNIIFNGTSVGTDVIENAPGGE